MGWGGVVTYFADRIGTMVQISSLAPEIVCVCVRYPFLQLCSPTVLTSESVLYANICTKNVHFMAEVRFHGAHRIFGVRVARVINSGIKDSINK